MKNALPLEEVIATFQHVIARVEKGTGLSILNTTLKLSTVTSKKAGVSTPEIWILPKDLISVGATEVKHQTIQFQLKPLQTVASTTDLVNDIGEIVPSLISTLTALEFIKKFTAEATLELEVEFSLEGKVSAIFTAGAGQTNGHSLAVTVALVALKDDTNTI
jgi:hypothetical protein